MPSLSVRSMSASLILLAALAAAPARAQYTDTQAITDHGGPQAFTARRASLAKTLGSGYILLFARNEIPEANHYREDNDFYYFTGLQDPGAVMALNAASGNAIIFEPSQPPNIARFYGRNLLALPQEERAALGFSTVLPVS